MNADEILKRDAELRKSALGFDTFWRATEGRKYLASIAAAERALVEAVGAWIEGVKIDPNNNRAQDIDLSKYHIKMCDAYRALLAAMEAAQQ